AFAAERPLPPEIDPRNTAVSTLFHTGGPERIDLALTLASTTEPLRYEVSIQGPVGAPRVARERLVSAGPLPKGATAPFAYLDRTNGKGTVRARRDEKFPAQLSAPPSELALRGLQNPMFGALSRFQRFVGSWHFYGGFDVSPEAAIRRPAH